MSVRYGQFVWIAYSRHDLICRSSNVCFSGQVNDLFMNYGNPLALLVAVNTPAEGVCAEFTIMALSLICSYLLTESP